MTYQAHDTIKIKHIEYTIIEALEAQGVNTRKMIWGTLYLKRGERGTKLYEAPINHDGSVYVILRTQCTVEEFQNRNS